MRVLNVVLLAVIAAIVAADATPFTTLGVPVMMGPVPKGSWSQFSVKIKDLFANLDGSDRVWFGVTPFTGDADMYVSTVKMPEAVECGHCIINSTSPFDELLHIRRDDARWPTDVEAFFYVGIHSYTQSEFSFNVWTDKTVGTLQESIPQVGHAEILKVVYYEYTLPASENFTISVTPRGGDMDIFVTTDPNIKPDSQKNATWFGTDIGFDTVSINTNHPKYVGAGNKYYIGIKGYSYNRLFTIFVTLNNNYTRIMEGIPLSTYAEGHEFRYFEFDVTSDYGGHKVTFNLISLKSGSDPDMYITRSLEQGHPGPSNCEWCNSGIGSDIREIDNAPAGKYYVGVRAFQRKAYFQITATTALQSIQLNPGSTYRGHVLAGQYNYYRWHHGNIREAFQVVVSPYAGSVELFESKSSPNPDEAKHERKGSPMGLDRVLNHKAYEDWTPKWYYFGVKGNQDANFTIHASTNYTATMLKDGYSSYYQYVANKYYKYFYFDITDHDLRDPQNAIAFSVSTFTGDADIFVSMSSHRPTIVDYEWKSDDYKSDTCVVYANDPKIGDRRRFYIAVYGASSSGSDTGFSILAHKSNSSIALHDGQPIHASVEYDKYVYFHYSVSDIGYKGPIKITITVPESNKKVIALADDSNNHRPTLTHYQWRSSTFGQVFLNIPDARDGSYYIGVLGWALGRNYTTRIIDFTISASRAYEVLNVNSGNLLRSLSAHAAPDRYRFAVDDVSIQRTSVDYISVALTLISGRARLYVNAGTNRTDDESYTNNENAYYRNESPNGNIVLVRKLNVGPWANHWNAVVYADENTDYFISASTASTVRGVAPSPYYSTPAVDLFEGVPMLQAAPFQDRFVYTIHLPPVSDNQKQDYEISLRILDGIVSVYASQDYNIVPNPRNYTFKAEKVKEDITIVLPKEKLDQSSFWGGRLFISVYGEYFPMLHGEANKYEITVYHGSSPRYLMQDQPLPQRILEDQFKGHEFYTHYRALNSIEHPEDLEVIVVSCEDLPAVVPKVFGSATNHYPRDGNSTYQGKTIGRFVEYFKTDSEKKQDERVFYVGVQHKPNHKTARNFTIYATTLDDSRPLIDNHQVNGRADNAQELGENSITFQINLAQHPKRYIDGKNFIYQVFSRELTEENINNLDNVNFHTTCALTTYGTQMNIAIHQQYNDSRPGTLEITAGPFDKSKTYIVNIYVHSESIFGLASTYHPVYVINGNFHQNWPSAPGMSPAGIFFLTVFIIFLVVCLAFVAYVGIGFAIKKKQGHYGWDAVPNSGLWGKLIKLVTCGKFAPGETYGSLRDEPTTTSSVNASQSGYGSV